jgi:hypothetical protein
MGKLFAVLLACVCVLTTSCVISSVTHKDSGPIILCGGGTVPPEAIEIFKSKVGQGKVVIVSTGELRSRWKDNLTNYSFILPEQLAKTNLDNVKGLIIEGGDQNDYLTRTSGKHIRMLHERGAIILGTSAGSMILGDVCFTAEKGTINSEQAKNNINVYLCKGFTSIKWLRDCVVDTHYSERNRQGRLRVFMDRGVATRGIGIDEATALYVDSKNCHVVGLGNVEFVTKVKNSFIARLTPAKKLDTMVAVTHQ